jgi:hypothetical protein
MTNKENTMDTVATAELIGCFHQVKGTMMECAIDVARSIMAPHLLYKASLSLDGNQWCWLYGDNLQEGIAGFGDTPAKAAIEFDRAWGFYK